MKIISVESILINPKLAARNAGHALDAKLAEAHFGMAEALKFSGRPAEAKAAYGAYLRLEPNGRDAAVAKRALDSL